MGKLKMLRLILNITYQPYTFVFTLLVSMALTSCTPNTACHTSRKNLTSTPLLQFQKTPCYGPCPAYEANIMDNGSITLISWGNIPVPAEDTVQLCLTKQQLQQVKTDIKALNYTSLQNAYLTEWTDRPTSYLTFYQSGKAVKRVKHQEGGPESLVEFQNTLHRQLMDLIEKQVK